LGRLLWSCLLSCATLQCGCSSDHLDSRRRFAISGEAQFLSVDLELVEAPYPPPSGEDELDAYASHSGTFVRCEVTSGSGLSCEAGLGASDYHYYAVQPFPVHDYLAGAFAWHAGISYRGLLSPTRRLDWQLGVRYQGLTNTFVFNRFPRTSEGQSYVYSFWQAFWAIGKEWHGIVVYGGLRLSDYRASWHDYGAAASCELKLESRTGALIGFRCPEEVGGLFGYFELGDHGTEAPSIRAGAGMRF
jgi:hypothetical protein